MLAGNQERLLSTVKCRNGYHSSAMSAVTIRSLPKIILQGTVDGSRRTGRPRVMWDINRPVVIVAALRGQQKSMDDHCGVQHDCRSARKTPRVLRVIKRNANAFSLNAIIDVCRSHEMVFLISRKLRQLAKTSKFNSIALNSLYIFT